MAGIVRPQEAAPQAAPAPAPEGAAPGGGGKDEAMAAIQNIGVSLSEMLKGMSQTGAPPEALKALQVANEAYAQFLEMVTGGGGAPVPQETSPDMAGGNPQAVPV